ncbi:MAG: RsmB/NOP family class I SAM-dependent RNA methyltransferase [Rhizobiaceae bacterium]
MRLGGRMAAAAEVLADMAARKRPVADALKDWGLSHRFAGSGDRAAIGNLVYDALRKKLSLGWRMGDDAPLPLVCAVLLDGWSETPASLMAKLEGDRFAPQLPSPEVLKAFGAADLSKAPDHVQADVPEWTVPHLRAMFGDDFIAECQAQTGRPPVDMRANRLLSTRDKVLADLPQDIGVVPSKLVADGLRIPAGACDYRQPNIQAEPAFQKGWFEIQDEGSQLAANLSGAAPGENVLDYCAGGGGKTLALASLMNNKGQVFATDSDKVRLAPIFDRLKRAETRNVQVKSAKSDLSDLEGAMDMVLIDAPCTGAGTWRRRPDAKWRLSPPQLEARIKEQASILQSAKTYVKPGGRLVYITCSLFREENEAQVEAFLAANSDFAATSGSDLAGQGKLDEQLFLVGKFGLTLTPRRTGTDGFFVSMLNRSA